MNAADAAVARRARRRSRSRGGRSRADRASASARRRRASAAPIELDSRRASHALGHEDRLEHVIGHLVQNALDATADDGRVRGQAARASGARASIEVGDTGAGMTPEFVRERLFKPFETTKRPAWASASTRARSTSQELGGEIAGRQRAGRGHARARAAAAWRRPRSASRAAAAARRHADEPKHASRC